MKRIVSVFFCLIFSLSLLLLRLWSLMNTAAESGSTRGTLSIEAAHSRGFFYDRNGLPFVNETARTLVAAAPVPTAPALLRPVMAVQDFADARVQWGKGLPAVVPVTKAVSGSGLFTIRQPIRYRSEFLIPHIAGYCDAQGRGVCGMEKGYEALLSTRTLRVTFDVDAAGRVLCGGQTRLEDAGVWSPRGVVLTIEKRLQALVRDALAQSDIRKGAAVLLRADTSEILAMVSVPQWDVHDVAASLENADAPFLDRALNPAAVGSVYKMIVAAALLENGVSEQFTYTCTGSTKQDDVTFYCHLHTGHGEQDMDEAMANSCNPWFIHAAREVPVDAILNLSWALGLGSETALAEAVTGGAGVLPDGAELSSDAARANIAFGQGRLTASPVQLAAATAALVTGGEYREPRLVLGTRGDDGTISYTQTSPPERVIRSETSDTLRRILVYAAGKTGRLSFKDCGGKTATAQTGVFHAGIEQLNTWYSGFFPAEKPQYILTVFCEDGTSGAADCIPVFERIAEEICKKQ